MKMVTSIKCPKSQNEECNKNSMYTRTNKGQMKWFKGNLSNWYLHEIYKYLLDNWLVNKIPIHSFSLKSIYKICTFTDFLQILKRYKWAVNFFSKQKVNIKCYIFNFFIHFGWKKSSSKIFNPFQSDKKKSPFKVDNKRYMYNKT